MAEESAATTARRAAVLFVLALCGAGAAGCGEAAVARHTTTSDPRPVKVVAVRGRTPVPARSSVVARIDASQDAIIAEGKVHIASGAPSDAEVKREIAAARKAGIVLPAGESVASFETGATTTGAVAGAETPVAVWNPRAKPIADWIVPVLEWAHAHGWSGTVTSGYRTYYEQAQLNAAGAFSAPAGVSNHETTAYPGGAVDVTEPAQLIAVLKGYTGPLKLIGGVLGPADPEHFSATGD